MYLCTATRHDCSLDIDAAIGNHTRVVSGVVFIGADCRGARSAPQLSVLCQGRRGCEKLQDLGPAAAPTAHADGLAYRRHLSAQASHMYVSFLRLGPSCFPANSRSRIRFAFQSSIFSPLLSACERPVISASITVQTFFFLYIDVWGYVLSLERLLF
jgi:hypothetical protein